MSDRAFATAPPTRSGGGEGWRVSQPGDLAERQADEVAESVLAGRRVTLPEAGPGGAATPPAGVAGSGQPLDPGTRALLEPRLGASFADVRVHTDGAAARLAEGLGSRAFTAGNDVVFGAGAYAPGTTEGQRLLAHELTHVVQRGPVIARQVRTDLDPAAQAETLIRQHTGWTGRVDRRGLAGAMLGLALRGETAVPLAVFDSQTLWRTSRDDVAEQFCLAAREPGLRTLAGSPGGRRLLDRLYDELTSGSVSRTEQQQANLILAIRASRISPQEYQRGSLLGKVFPIRVQGFTVVSDAPISARLLPDGRVHVRLPVRVRGTREFAAEVRTLPNEVFLRGITLDVDEVIGVRLYDLGGQVLHAPALILVQLSNQSDATTIAKILEGAAIGATLGLGGVGGAAAEGSLAVRGLVRLGIQAERAASVLAAADRIAFGLSVLTSLLKEHRGALSRLPYGRPLVDAIDRIQTATLYYGIARVVVEAPLLVVALRDSYRRWRGAQPPTTDPALVGNISRETEATLRGIDEIAAARAGTRPPGAAAGGEPAVEAGAGAGALAGPPPSATGPAPAGPAPAGPATTTGPPPAVPAPAGPAPAGPALAGPAPVGPAPVAAGGAGAGAVRPTGGASPLTAGRGGIRTIHRADVGPVGNKEFITTIEGRLLPTIRRTDLERQILRPPAEVGLSGWDRAHLWGPIFGDEAAAGILYARAGFNRGVQLRLEQVLRSLRQDVAGGGEVLVTATNRSFPQSVAGGRVLAELKYEFTVRLAGGQTGRRITVEFTLEPPGPLPPGQPGFTIGAPFEVGGAL
jgi:hypothetical protein